MDQDLATRSDIHEAAGAIIRAIIVTSAAMTIAVLGAAYLLLR